MKRENYEMLNSLFKLKRFTISQLEKHIKTMKDDDVKEASDGILHTHITESNILERILKSEDKS